VNTQRYTREFLGTPGTQYAYAKAHGSGQHQLVDDTAPTLRRIPAAIPREEPEGWEYDDPTICMSEEELDALMAVSFAQARRGG
jgi:hypothetical protein